jgi:hypothetical protein
VVRNVNEITGIAAALSRACARALWSSAADDGRILLHEKRLSELQRLALRRDLDRIDDEPVNGR